MKVGIWKIAKLDNKRGFILLEALVCLSVLAILLPLAHKTILQSWKKYHHASLKESAARLATFELSNLETQILKGHFENDTISKQGFHLDHTVTEETAGLKKISINVRWQTSEGPQIYSIEEWVFSNPSEESRELKDED